MSWWSGPSWPRPAKSSPMSHVRRPLPSPSGMATVLLVDDDPCNRLLMRILLGRTRRFIVVGEAANGSQAVAKARTLRPDVVVLDFEMPGMSGPHALPLIRRVSMNTKIIMFSDRVAGLSTPQAEALGADLLSAKGDGCSGLLPALHRVWPAAPRPTRRIEPRIGRASPIMIKPLQSR